MSLQLKAAGFLEALRPDFKDYIKSVLANAKILSETLKNNGFKIYSGWHRYPLNASRFKTFQC